MVRAQGPREDGLVVRAAVPQRAQLVQRLVSLSARQGRAVVGKRPRSAGRQSVFS